MGYCKTVSFGSRKTIVQQCAPAGQQLGEAFGTRSATVSTVTPTAMFKYFFLIDDDLAGASPILERMRRDGLERAWVPFAERHFLAWRGSPAPNMDTDTILNALKVPSNSLPWTKSLSAQHQVVRCSAKGCRQSRQAETLQSQLARRSTFVHFCACAPVLCARTCAACGQTIDLVVYRWMRGWPSR